MSVPSGLSRSLGTEVVIDSEFEANVRRAQQEAIRKSVRSFPSQVKPLLKDLPPLKEMIYGGAAVQRYIENGFQKDETVNALLKQAGLENGDSILKEASRIYGLDPNDPIRDLALRLTPGALGVPMETVAFSTPIGSSWNEETMDLDALQQFARESGIDSLLGWETSAKASPTATPGTNQPSLMGMQPIFGAEASFRPSTLPVPPILQPTVPTQPNTFIAKSVDQSAIQYFLQGYDYDPSFTVEAPFSAIQSVRNFGENPNAMPGVNQSFFLIANNNKKYIPKRYSQMDDAEDIRKRIAPAIANTYQLPANSPNLNSFVGANWIVFALIRPANQAKFAEMERGIKARIQQSVIAAAQAGRAPVRWELIEQKEGNQTIYKLIPYFYSPSANGPSYRPIIIQAKTQNGFIPMPLEYVFLDVEEMRHWFSRFQFHLKPEGGIYKMVWKGNQNFGLTPAQIVNQLNKNRFVPLIVAQTVG